MDDAQTAMDVEDVYELSPMQLGMLFQSLLAPESGVFFEQQVIRISAEFHSVAFERAWQMLVDRTPVLRASFHWEGLEKPVQVVHRRVAVPVEYLDWRSVPPAAQSDRLGDYLRVVRRTGFDFATAPLMRIALIDLGGTEFLFVWHFHHILLDGWSGQLVLQELVEQYAALCGGADFTPPQRPPFSDYIAWLQRQDFDKAEAYWRDLLRDFTTPTPLGIGRPPVDGEARSGFEGELVVTLSADQSEALRGFARRNRLTLNTLLQAAWALLLSRYSGETDIVYGTVVSGRPTDLPGVEMMIGLFINTLPMRVATPADAELVSWLKDLQQRQVEASQYQYVSLLQIQRWSALPAGTDLFDTVLIFENFPTAPVARNGETAEAAEPIYLGRTNVPISILVIPGSCLRLKFVFDERRFTAESIERVGAHLRMLLEHFLARPNAQLGSISVLSPDERHRILVEWNATAMVGFEEKSLVALLAEQVWRAPDAVAFYCGEESVTLRSLDDRSSQLASYLINRGIGHGSIVGVCLERSIEAAIAFLAILKARAVYLPLDPSYPPSRLAYMLDDAGATLVLTKDDAASWTSRTLVVDLAAERPVIDGCDAACPMPHPAPDDIAYVIYTSGSTGRPKGVLAQHRQILNRLFWMWQAYPFAPGEVGAVRTALNFVDSFWELLGALLRGVPSVILRERDVRDLPTFVDLLASAHVTRLWFVPSFLEMLLNAYPGIGQRLPALRFWSAGGEPLSAELYHRFTKAAPDAVLYNTYGASEIWDGTFYDPMVDGPVTDEVPLGRPIANTEAYILDRHLQPVPVGIAGELCFGGACLVKGYHNRDNLTRERFIPHPFRDAPGARLYRTGDLVRFRSNGVIDYVGRNDFLINLRGFRIEPAEIEAVLDEHSSVRESLVVVRDASPGNKRLIAYAVPAGVQTDIGELITHMRERLPIFMVPATVIWIESIPLTPSGKRDRQNLPAPLELQSAQWAQTDDPRTNLEKRIAAHFRDVLGAPSVGIHDNFFTDLGGHSLLATRLISRLRDDFRIDLPLRLVFESPTIERLAAALVNRIADPGDEAVAAILADAEELSDEEVSSLLEEVRDKFTETRP